MYVYVRIHISQTAVERNGTRFLVEAGGNGIFRHRVDQDTEIPSWVSQAISRGEYAYALIDLDHAGTVRRIRKG